MINMLSPSWKRSQLRSTTSHALQGTRRSLSAAIRARLPLVTSPTAATRCLLSLTLMTTFALLTPNPLKAQNSEAAKGGVRRATHSNPRFTKRPPETTDEEIAATDEIARWAGLHPEIAYYESRRVPPKDGAPWTVEVYVEVGPKVTLKWSEVGWSHLLDAVHEIEKDYDAFPRGHEGHSSE